MNFNVIEKTAKLKNINEYSIIANIVHPSSFSCKYRAPKLSYNCNYREPKKNYNCKYRAPKFADKSAPVLR